MGSEPDINGKAHFNEWSTTYEQSITQWLLFDRVHQGVLNRIPGNFTPGGVLDIGCGTGRLLRRFGKRWPATNLIGLDIADGMLRQARLRTPAASFYLASAEQIPFPDASIDLVTSTTSFHHWSDQAQGICQAARVLRPGGLFILADMSLSMHGHPLSAHQVRSMFEAAGLVVRKQNSPVLFYTFTVGEKMR